MCEKNRDIKLLTIEARRNYLVSEPIMHNFFFRKCFSHINEKHTKV